MRNQYCSWKKILSGCFVFVGCIATTQVFGVRILDNDDVVKQKAEIERSEKFKAPIDTFIGFQIGSEVDEKVRSLFSEINQQDDVFVGTLKKPFRGFKRVELGITKKARIWSIVFRGDPTGLPAEFVVRGDRGFSVPPRILREELTAVINMFSSKYPVLGKAQTQVNKFGEPIGTAWVINYPNSNNMGFNMGVYYIESDGSLYLICENIAVRNMDEAKCLLEEDARIKEQKRKEIVRPKDEGADMI